VQCPGKYVGRRLIASPAELFERHKQAKVEYDRAIAEVARRTGVRSPRCRRRVEVSKPKARRAESARAICLVLLCDLSLAWGLSRMFQHSGAGLFYLDHSLVRNAMRPIFVKCPVMNGTGVTGSSSQRPLGINPGRPWSFHGAISDAGAARPIWGVGYSDCDKSNLWAALSHGALSLLAT
jgi:hypothetical protein